MANYEMDAFAQESKNADEIKAAYIYNILKFTTWPNNTTSSVSNNFAINDALTLKVCLYGTPDAVTILLADKLRGRTVQNQSIVIAYIPELTDHPDDKAMQTLDNCKMLYIGETSKNQEAWLTDYAEKKSILTVSDSIDFSQGNGIVELKTDLQQGKVLILINTDAARKANISFSSKLLQLAQLITINHP